MSTICVRTENLSKRFLMSRGKETVLQMLKALVRREPLKDEHWVLRNVSLEIKRSEKIAIVGKNAAGKTTLLRIITGIYDKTSGCVSVSERPSALFKSAVGLNLALSVVDNIYLFGAYHRIRHDFLKDKLEEILKTSELYEQRFCPAKELSTGQKQQLAISVFCLADSKFVIFDDILTYTDARFVKKFDKIYFQNLCASDTTVIISSHHTPFLRRYCTRAIWLDRGCIRMDGNVAEVIDAYERSCSLELPAVSHNIQDRL